MESSRPQIAPVLRKMNMKGSRDQLREGCLHQSSVLDVVCLDKMLTDQMLCDVLLVAEGVEISAHKLILAASSTFFYWKFTNDRKLGLIKRIEIRDMTYETLSSIIAYIYMTEILISEINVWNLLRAACMFALRDLQKACQEFLKANLQVKNCLDTEIIARQTQLGEVESVASDYVDAHFADIIREDAHLGLTYGNFLRVISRHKLCAREVDILESVLKWISFDVDNRKEHVYDLMKHVSFPLISQKHIIQKFEQEYWLKSDSRFYPFLVDILKFHILNEPQVLSSEYRQLQSTLLVTVGKSDASELSLEMYDFHKKIWLACPEALHIKCGFDPRAIIHGSTVYCLYDSKLRSMDITNPKTLKWSEPTELLEKRQNSSLAVLNNRIYAVGGICSNQHLVSAEKFDTSSRTWEKIARVSLAKRNLGLCVFNGSLFAVGGQISNTMECNTVECYESDTDSWHTLPNMTLKRCLPGVAAMCNKLYVVGGSTSSNPCNYVEVFDPDEASWTRLPDMQVARRGPGVIAIEDRLYVVGGYNNSGYLTSVEVFDSVSNTWSMIPSSMHTGKECVAVGLVDKSKIILNCSED